MDIHPTAIIDPAARIGANVRIGPYCVIAADVSIGAGTTLHSHVVLYSGVHLGEKNLIYSGAVLGANPQDLGFEPQTSSTTEIGDGNTIREHVTIHRGSKAGGATHVGDQCFLMAGSHLGHDVRIGNNVILANNCLLAGHVQIGDRVFMGGGVAIHQFTRVGRLAILQGTSGFGKDVPPFCLGAGINTVAALNVIGMRRAGMDASERAEIKAAFDLVYRSGLNVQQALQATKERSWGANCTEFFAFIAASKRGICALSGND